VAIIPAILTALTSPKGTRVAIAAIERYSIRICEDVKMICTVQEVITDDLVARRGFAFQVDNGREKGIL